MEQTTTNKPGPKEKARALRRQKAEFSHLAFVTRDSIPTSAIPMTLRGYAIELIIGSSLPHGTRV